MKPERGGRITRVLVGLIAASGLAVGAAACGESGAAGTPLSPAGERGKQLAQSSGCAGCHGTAGQGGVGPPWQGLAGSEVELADGSTVVADQAYLVRAIKEPQADLLADYRIQMPRNRLDDAQIDDVVAYITDLAEVSPGN